MSRASVRTVTMALMAITVVAPLACTPPTDAAPAADVTPATGTDPVTRSDPGARPPIVQRPIPYGAQRRHQMARYSKIHYGTAEWRLTPRGIVQHYTATNSLESVLATFRANQPDPELGQLPGVCTHFVIDRDGTIYQLVSTSIRCRHTVGLNDSMIGIEHVGMSDAAVMGNRRQRQASLALTSWLVSELGLSTGDVIGHNESVRSRFHHELYGPWRCQTHGDFTRRTMNDYRHRLNQWLAGTGADTSRPRWAPSSC